MKRGSHKTLCAVSALFLLAMIALFDYVVVTCGGGDLVSRCISLVIMLPINVIALGIIFAFAVYVATLFAGDDY